MISIIGGKFKRKKINVPEDYVRPTSLIKREAIFSILESLALKKFYNLYKNKCFIDFFSGTGALGLEAISRGASFSYFYDKNNIEMLKKNCDLICLKNQYKIFSQDIMKIERVDIEHPLSAIFIDPPYSLDPFDYLLNKIIKSDILEKNSIIVIETHKNISVKIPKTLDIIKEKKFGITKLIFITI